VYNKHIRKDYIILEAGLAKSFD